MIKEYKIEQNKIVETSNNSTIVLSINPTKDEKDILCKSFNIDEYSLQSALDPMELSRIEVEPDDDWFLIMFKQPVNYSGKDKFLFEIGTVGIYIHKNRLLIVSALPIMLNFSKVKSIYDVVLRLIGSATNHFRDHLLIINKISEEIQGGINTAIVNKHLIELLNLQKTLVYYVDSISSNNGLLGRMLKVNNIKLEEHTLELLEDVIIENNQCLKQAEIYSNILASLMDARASLINNNISVMVKNLTMVTISIMIPTFIVSIFSMNVSIPLQSNPYLFWYILGAGACVAGGLLPIWRKKD